MLFCFCSCKKFEISPYAVSEKGLPTQVNKKNIAKLKALDSGSDDTIRIFLCGDSQRFYDELDDMVNKANSCNIDFVLLAGDITDFGLENEFLWVYERLEKLNKPYISVVGNHDFNGNGSAVYSHVFGERNFSFTFRNYKFLCHDTNSREHGFDGSTPDINWLSAQMNSDASLYYAAVSHVPPFDVDFDKQLEESYRMLFADNSHFNVSMHGHLHNSGISEAYDDGVQYVVTNAIGNREAYIIKLYNGNMATEKVTF